MVGERRKAEGERREGAFPPFQRQRRPSASRLSPFAFRLVVIVALIGLVAPTGGAQLPPLPPSPLDPVAGQAQETASGHQESTLGLQREEIDVTLNMEFRDVDFDTLNVIFGGGKFSATARIQARVDMRVLAGERIQGALEGVAPGSSNLTGAAGLGQTYIPADVFRSTLSGEAIAAFQDEQEERVAQYLMKTVPNVSVLNTVFEWSNVSPEDSYEKQGEFPDDPSEANDATFPPLTLDATIDIQYLERTSLLGILDKALVPKSEAEKERKRQVADAAAAYDRSAFGLLGIRQVLDLQAPEGWNLRVHVTLPEGFTFEEASPDVALASNLREADVLTLGRDAEADVLNPVALTLSNRFIVSTAMLASVLLLGTILRFPVLLATNFVRRKLRH